MMTPLIRWSWGNAKFSILNGTVHHSLPIVMGTMREALGEEHPPLLLKFAEETKLPFRIALATYVTNVSWLYNDGQLYAAHYAVLRRHKESALRYAQRCVSEQENSPLVLTVRAEELHEPPWELLTHLAEGKK